jgi:sec-independent protein translocase protein TatB
MPTIGWFEILIIVGVAIVVIGPKDFPVMLKKVGSWIGSAKSYIQNIQEEVSNIDIDNIELDNKKDSKNKDKINEKK